MAKESGGDAGRGGPSRGGGRDSGRGDSGRGGGSRGGSHGGGSRGEGRGGESSRGDLIDKVIKIKRCAAVVKGGRRFSFAAMVVVGNGRGKVGWGYGKANEVPPSVEKAVKDGSRNLIEVPIEAGTLPHAVKGHFGAGSVVMIPASPGTGVIAGAAVRSVCEAAGIHDVLTKCYGSTNPVNLVKATIDALKQLRPRHEVERLRGVSLA